MEKIRPLKNVSDRISDTVVTSIGSWPFILIEFFAIILWIVANLVIFSFRWDPYPFVFLNLCLGFVSAFSAPFIMMSQNRVEERDRDTMLRDEALDQHSEELVIALQKQVSELYPLLLQIHKEVRESQATPFSRRKKEREKESLE